MANQSEWWKKPKNEPVVILLKSKGLDPSSFIERDFETWSIFSTLNEHVSINYKRRHVQMNSNDMSREHYHVCKRCKGWMRAPVEQGVFDLKTGRFEILNEAHSIHLANNHCAWCANDVLFGKTDYIFVEAPRVFEYGWNTATDKTFHDYAVRTGIFDGFSDILLRLRLLPLLRARKEKLHELMRQQRYLENALF